MGKCSILLVFFLKRVAKGSEGDVARVEFDN